MIESPKNGRGGTASTGAATRLYDRLDELVAAKIVNPGERRLQALTIGVLIASGLLMATASPVLAVLEAGSLALAVPLMTASLAIAVAAYLSATGAFDHMAWIVGTTLLLAFGLGASAPEVPLGAWLVGLGLAPGTAWLAGRRNLACGLAGSAATVATAAMLLAREAPRMVLSDLLALTALVLICAVPLLRQMGKRLSRAKTIAAPRALVMADAAELFGAAMLSLDAEGRVLLASECARALLAGDDGPLDGRPLLDLVLVADRVVFLNAMTSAKAGRRDTRVAARIRRPDGAYVPTVMRLLVAPGPDDGGVAVHVAIVPVVEERETAPGLQRALDAAQQSSAAKSQFLAAVSHELRTPLNAIIGFSDILDQEFFGGFESERQKEYVGLIRQSGQHLLSVVNTLLDVSKIEAGRYELMLEPFAMEETMTAAAGVVQEEARRKGLRLDIRSGCRGETIVADQRACHQILLNLLSNAVKFTDVGVVTLESRIVEGSVVLSVSDTGIGIAEADIERLGRPFTQISSGAARRYQGTGLGLSLVKGLAELHGGAMTIHSAPGIGTMVSVHIPTDCAARTDGSQNLKENIVALSNARTKTTSQSQELPTRRTA